MWIDGREWKLVPVEPTLEMLDSADDAIRDFPRPVSRYETPLAPKIAYYKAMLAAAPTPPTAAQEKAAPSDEDIIASFSAAGMHIDPTPNRLYDIRGQYAQLINGARALLSRYGQAPTANAEPKYCGYPNCWSTGGRCTGPCAAGPFAVAPASAANEDAFYATLYRWLRANYSTVYQWGSLVWYPYDGKTPERLDAAIIAAINHTSGNGE